jgi:hypothetical protein
MGYLDGDTQAKKPHPFTDATIDCKKVSWHIDQLTKMTGDVRGVLIEIGMVLKDVRDSLSSIAAVMKDNQSGKKTK